MSAEAWTVSEFDFIVDEARELGIVGAVPPVERVELAGISALTWGKAPAQVVFLHGAALNAHTWDATILSWGIPAIALDLPGHGHTAWREDGTYSPRVIAPQVAAAIAKAVDTGVVDRGAILVGQSLGGLTGVEVISLLPGVFGHLVLVDILPLPADSAKAVAQFLDGPSVFRTRDQIVERSLTFGFGGSLESLKRAVYLNTTELPGGEIAWRHHLGVLGGGALPSRDLEDGWDAIAGVTVPLDLIWARHGILGANSLARLSQVVPSARHVGLDAGHNIQEDAPRDLAATLARLTGRVLGS